MNVNPSGRPPEVGIEDIQALAVSTVTALQESNLAAEAEMIHTRVLSRSPEELLEQVESGAQKVWTFKPFVELLMHELRYVATAPHFTPRERSERVLWALDMAGF